MLKNIKSSIIFKTIFNKLFLKNKFKLFRYNKSFQKKLTYSLMIIKHLMEDILFTNQNGKEKNIIKKIYYYLLENF